jgi:hypothetical protein
MHYLLMKNLAINVDCTRCFRMEGYKHVSSTRIERVPGLYHAFVCLPKAQPPDAQILF